MDKSLNSKTMPESLVASVMQSAMATDYRIGNIIQYNNEIESTGTITALIADFVAGLDYCQIDYRNNKKHWLINIKPIPLTEEWLVKLGFQKEKDRLFGKCFTSKHRKLKLVVSRTGLFTPRGFGSDLKYVHQLQNLYFALTQHELAVA